MSGWVYILTNNRNTVFYTGVTNNIARRVQEHKEKLVRGFTAKYNVSKLIFAEQYLSIEEAIEAEKKIKGWTRNKKLELIKLSNPQLEEIIIDSD